MASNVTVEVTESVSATYIMQCLDVTVGGVRYKYAGAEAGYSYLKIPSSNQAVWKQKGYFGGVSSTNNLGYVSTSSTPNSDVTFSYANNNKELVIAAHKANARMMYFSDAPSNGTIVPPWYQSDTIETVRFVGYSGSKVVASSLNYMFYGCSKLKSVNFANLDITTYCRQMNNMFQNCTSLETFDGRGLDTSRIEQMQYVFDGCSNLRSVDLSQNNLDNVWIIYRMFSLCPKLTGTLTLDEKGTSVKFPARKSAGASLCHRSPIWDKS